MRWPEEPEIRADGAATVVFVVVTAVAVIGPDAARVVAAGFSGVLFAIGTALTAVAILAAIGRSRTEAISVADLFLVTVADRRTRIWLHGCLGAQVVAGLAGAAVRPFTALAFGVLVPMFGIGVNGWWSARRGTFPPRDEPVGSGEGEHPG